LLILPVEMKDIDLSFEFIDNQDRFTKSTIKKTPPSAEPGGVLRKG